MRLARRLVALALAPLAACGVTAEQYDARTAELRKAEERTTRCYNQLHDAESARAQAQLDTDALRIKVRKLEQAPPAPAPIAPPPAATGGDDVGAQAERDRTRGLLTRALREPLGAGTIALDERLGRLRVLLPAEHLFRGDGAAPSPAGKKLLGQVGRALGALGPERLLVAGHGDERAKGARAGALAATVALGLQRATAVAAELVGAGIEARRVAIAGFGDNDPLDDRDVDEARARNRRVEIALLGPATDAAPKTIVDRLAPPPPAPAPPGEAPAPIAPPPAARAAAPAPIAAPAALRAPSPAPMADDPELAAAPPAPAPATPAKHAPAPAPSSPAPAKAPAPPPVPADDPGL